MRIAKAEARWLRFDIAADRQHKSDFGLVTTFDAAIVRIETADGIVGWGEGKNAHGSAGTYGALVALFNEEMLPKLIGRDPRDITPIWEDLFNGVRAHHARNRGHVMPVMAKRGHTVAAISGIDIALWDIFGKSVGLPVHRLLGGAKATHLPAYASGGWADAAGIGAQLQGYIDKGGFKTVKMRVGAMDGTARRSADRVIAARAALGPHVDIAVDSHGTFTVAEAKRFAHLVADCDLAWFEEPVTAEDPAGIAELRQAISFPVSAGESLATRFEFRDLIAARAADILQPDLGFCGGITEGMRIGALASAHNLRLAPHLWAGAPAFYAGLHLCAAHPAAHILEFSLGANPMLFDLVEEELVAHDGMLAIPTGPGLGFTVKEHLWDKQAIRR